MALAFSNPNDRRRINKIARLVVKKGGDPIALVAKWVKTKGKSAEFKRQGTKGSRGAALKRGLAKAKPTSKARRAEYRAAKEAVALAFGTFDGYKGSRLVNLKTGKRSRRSTAYYRAATGTKARRYLSAAKRRSVPKMVFGTKRQAVVLDVDGVRAANAVIVAGRASGGRGWRKLARKGKKGGQTAVRAVAAQRKGRKGKKGKGKAARANGIALANRNGLALTNPSLGGAQRYIMGSVPVILAGAAAGGIHALAGSYGVTEKISDTVAMVPVIGEPIATYAPFTLQGFLVGSVLGLVGAKIGGQAGGYLKQTGVATLVFGGGIDAFNYLAGTSAGSEELDLEAPLAGFGDLALENLGDLALTNASALGDGFAWQTAPLTADGSAEYGQASLADAAYSGADFSASEGQALLNGPSAWFSVFGNAPIRTTHIRGTASHLAGREGHRWGWLVKTVGFARAMRICALPPKKRLQVLRAMRQAALAAFQEQLLAQRAEEVQAAPASAANAYTDSAGPTLISGDGAGFQAAQGPQGATSPFGSAYGDPALFAGE